MSIEHFQAKKTCLCLALFLALSAVFSCSKKPLTLEERFASTDPKEVRSALTDMWRTGDGSSLATAVRLLDSKEYYEDAAFSLSSLNSAVIDSVVLAGMVLGRDNTGRLLYFYMVSKKRPIPAELSKFSQPDFKGSEHDKALQFKEALSVRNAKTKIKFKRDFKDGVITQNPFLAKYGSSPMMPAVPNTYKAWHTANPDILVHDKTIYFYYRGGDGTDRICLATAPYESFNGSNFTDFPGNPIIGTAKKGYDSRAALDPAAVYFNNRVFLYYSALGDGEDFVGLAVSKDFNNFKKYAAVIKGRAPAVIVRDGVIYMYYVAYNLLGGYSVYLATSRDGYNFVKYNNKPVFEPDPDPKAWDSKSETVPRITEKEGL